MHYFGTPIHNVEIYGWRSRFSHDWQQCHALFSKFLSSCPCISFMYLATWAAVIVAMICRSTAAVDGSAFVIFFFIVTPIAVGAAPMSCCFFLYLGPGQCKTVAVCKLPHLCRLETSASINRGIWIQLIRVVGDSRPIMRVRSLDDRRWRCWFYLT